MVVVPFFRLPVISTRESWSGNCGHEPRPKISEFRVSGFRVRKNTLGTQVFLKMSIEFSHNIASQHSMSISFDAAVASLKVMFPDWDEETLSTLLIANNYHVERTIETILTMLGDPNASSVVESSQPPPPVIQSRPVPAPAPRYATFPAAVAPLTSLQPPELHQTASGAQLSRIIS